MTQSRRMLVLRAVIEDYIRSQEPVGSTSLTRNHHLGVSSATVRNDMAALEDEGYLVQPHTSAGRIPTEKGYRYFVDRLATVVPLSPAQRRGIGNFLAGSVSLEDTLQRAARLLARITGQVAVVASPALSKSTLRHIEIVPVSVNKLLAVIITDTGRVAQHTLEVRPLPEPQALAAFSRTINARCAGVSLSAASATILDLGKTAEHGTMVSLATALSSALNSMADDERATDLYMAGTSKLAHQHSGADMAPLLDALEEQVVIMRLMNSLSEEVTENGVGVAIGSETHTPELMHASVVTSGYGHTHTRTSDDAAGKLTGKPVAFVGSIGPTHMDYVTTMTAVRAVARYLTGIIGEDDAPAADDG